MPRCPHRLGWRRAWSGSETRFVKEECSSGYDYTTQYHNHTVTLTDWPECYFHHCYHENNHYTHAITIVKPAGWLSGPTRMHRRAYMCSAHTRTHERDRGYEDARVPAPNEQVEERVHEQDGSPDDEAPVREKHLLGPRLDLVAIELTAGVRIQRRNHNTSYHTIRGNFHSRTQQCERATYFVSQVSRTDASAPRAYCIDSLVVEGKADQEQEPASDRENHDGNGELWRGREEY